MSFQIRDFQPETKYSVFISKNVIIQNYCLFSSRNQDTAAHLQSKFIENNNKLNFRYDKSVTKYVN